MGALHPPDRRRRGRVTSVTAPSVVDPGHRWYSVIAAAAGGVLGAFELINTGIGWHLASGRWMLDHRMILRSDPFSFTAAGTPWLDHEWLFQILVAFIDGLCGPSGLVILRMIAAATLAIVLSMIGRRRGLHPAIAMLLAVVCVWGARPRLFVRPELATLILVPLGVELFLDRARFPVRNLVLLATLVAIGANLHAGILVVPPILVALLGAELAGAVWRRTPVWRSVRLGGLTILVSSLAAILNPAGWRLYLVPLHISRLVGLPWIPNPEWISPSPTDAPALWAAMILSLAILALARERDPVRWMVLMVTAALALRHIRNVGLFFVLLPTAVAAALARWPILSARPSGSTRWRSGLAIGCSAVVAISAAVAPWPPFGFGWASSRYPERALTVIRNLGLDRGHLYNDVRFGGYLIWRGYPDRQVFLDDRNEIHEPLLHAIWDILQASDVAGWNELLMRWKIDVAMVRYHPPVAVSTPQGDSLGMRGFSALWFDDSRWALIYFDDAAMVLVRRDGADPDLLATHEYRHIRPDDGDELGRQLAASPDLGSLVAAEVRRALTENPDSRRAAALGEIVTRARRR